MIYCLCIDNSVQWFTAIFEIDLKEFKLDPHRVQATKRFDVSSDISGPFLSNLTNKEMSFSNKVINGASWYGWWISKFEFDRILRIIELQKCHLEYEKLLQL